MRPPRLIFDPSCFKRRLAPRLKRGTAISRLFARDGENLYARIGFSGYLSLRFHLKRFTIEAKRFVMNISRYHL